MSDNFTMGLSQTPDERRGVEGDVRAMRKALIFGQRDSALLNRCFRMAEIQGLSSEETYLLIAYFALCQVEDLWQRQLTLTKLDIRQPFMTMEPPK